MEAKFLLLSSDDKTVRVLRRVLSDLEIGFVHSSTSDDAIRRITRERFEAIIVDCADYAEASNVMRACKAAPVNKRALSIVLVEASVGLKGGFELGAHFVLHKPLTVERAKASFRAVRALMKSERRLQLRVPVQVPVSCLGSARYPAKTLDLCEGGMAIQFTGRVPRESDLRFSLALPGITDKLDLWGELAWEGGGDRAGVRFTNVTDPQRKTLRTWLNSQLPEPEPDDPPVVCRVKNFSHGDCYLTTVSPFPKSTRVILSLPADKPEIRASGVVRLTHPEFGMGIEFFRTTPEQQQQLQQILKALRVAGDSPEIHVAPDGLESPPENAPAPHKHKHPHSPSLADSPNQPGSNAAVDDALVHLFQQNALLPVEVFMEQMQQTTQAHNSR